MRLRGFAKEVTLTGDSGDRVLDCGVFTRIFYEKRPDQREVKVPFPKITPQKRVKRERTGTLQLTRCVSGTLTSDTIADYTGCVCGPLLMQYLLSLVGGFSRLMHRHRPPTQDNPTLRLPMSRS